MRKKTHFGGFFYVFKNVTYFLHKYFMPFTPNDQLKPDPTIILRDRQTAARIFVDDQFRLFPKPKFLFHVAFGINPKALKDIKLRTMFRNEINILVKTADLPIFNVTAETANQYNRKKVIQTTHKYGETQITFHDDSANIINQLWQNYYLYYYSDPTVAATGKSYGRNATQGPSYIHGKYGLDNGSTVPFFNYVTLYQMSGHMYNSYRLINPVITHWNHNKVDHSSNQPQDYTMKLAYEAVAYGAGPITETSGPEGFAAQHYDLTPSPLYGQTYPNTAAINDVASQTTASQLAQIATYAIGAQTAAERAATGSSNGNNIGGVSDVLFPTGDTMSATPASLNKLI
jgi:hypothetical protein